MSDRKILTSEAGFPVPVPVPGRGWRDEDSATLRYGGTEPDLFLMIAAMPHFSCTLVSALYEAPDMTWGVSVWGKNCKIVNFLFKLLG